MMLVFQLSSSLSFAPPKENVLFHNTHRKRYKNSFLRHTDQVRIHLIVPFAKPIQQTDPMEIIDSSTIDININSSNISRDEISVRENEPLATTNGIVTYHNDKDNDNDASQNEISMSVPENKSLIDTLFLGIEPSPEIIAIMAIYFVEGALGLARLA